MFEGLDNDVLIVVGSAFAAAISFIAFALPFLTRGEKKERYRSVIEKKRKELFQATREQVENRGKATALDTKKMSGRESMALFFKVQELAGKMGQQVRDKMLQAGIRSPTAPLKYVIATVGLPVLFGLLAITVMSASDKEVSKGVAVCIVFAVVLFGFFLPRILVKNMIVKRQKDINMTFPDALDMMLICVQGGIGLEQTINRVAEEVSEYAPTLAEELGILSAEMSMLNDRKAAMQDFARRVGSGGAKTFATAMIQAEQYGTSVSQALRVLSDEIRDARMQEAERKAMALPPKLTVPMILFFLPALFIVILGPVGVKASQMNLGG